MMKNLRKYALISLLMVLAIVILSTTSNASGELFIQGSGSEDDLLLINTENQTSENTTTTPEPNTVSTNILGTTNNVQKVNNINDASKDIPQTGENDVYMIATIGIIAVAIGGFTYVKSKKYDIK